MAVLATSSITLAVAVDVARVDNYYLLQSSTATPPTKPTTANPSNWLTTEPNYDGTNTNTLYVCQKTTLSDGTFYWSAVSKSSSYEAAKQAANAAAAALDAANSAVVTKSMSGERTIVTEDAADLPLLTLSPVYGESVQDGTPTPDAPVYIQAVRGLNLLLGSDSMTQDCSGGTGTNIETTAYKGASVSTQVKAAWGGPYLRIGQALTRAGVSVGTVVTLSIRFTVSSITTVTTPALYLYRVVNSGQAASYGTRTLKFGEWITLSYTFTVTDFALSTVETEDRARFESSAATDYYFIYSAPQLEVHSSVHDYVPYDHLAIVSELDGQVLDTTYIDLKGNELHGLDSTYRDVLTIDASGHAVIEKRTERLIGPDFTQYNTSNGYIAYKTSSLPVGSNLFKSNFFSTSESFSSSAMNKECIQAATTSSITAYIALESSRDKTNFEYIYALAESSWHTIDLGYVDLPQVTDGSTVYVAAEVQPVIGGSWWTKAGYSVGNLAQQTKDSQGALEPPYTELEWVESDGTQYVYLDWKPPIATWGFEADFIIRNTFNTTQAAWRADTNASNSGCLFGTRNASSVNDVQLTTYGSTGLLRNGAGSYTTSGLLKTDKSRQQVSYRGTALKRGDGTSVTFARTSETANKPYANMVVFAYHDGVRRSGTGSVLFPSTSRIYSLKFYDGDALEVDLVGAIRNRDGMTGLYDKVKGHFYPAAGLLCGSAVGALGEPDTVAKALAKKDPKVYVDNRAVSRMWRVEVPGLDELEDGQKLTVYFSTNVGGTTPNAVAAAGIDDFAGQWDEAVSTSYTNVYLKLDLADGSETEWIPCYYAQGTRLTSHYGSGTPVLLTYRENILYGATATSAGTSVMRAWYADANYNTDDPYTRYSETVIAGLNGVKRYSLCMRDANGNWTSIMNQANNVAATGKTAYAGGLMLGNVLYHNSGSDIAAGGNTGQMSESRGGIDFRYDVNGVTNAAATTELQLRKPVYLVGTVDGASGLFYLDQTKWWTQNPVDPAKVYVQLGTAYNSYYAIFLSVDNPTLVYDEDAEKLVPLSLTITTFSNKYNTLVDTVDEHTTKVGVFEAQINGHYATCATAAGTAAKVATIDPATTSWALYKGATIAVKFQNASTAAAPTLNVNGTGAKGIRSYKGAALVEAEYKWEAGALITFVYDGTNWVMQDEGAMKRLKSAETTIQQTANNVLIKATENDTTAAQGGQHLIQSLINVAPSGVTIDAAKVDIEGAAIFTGSGRLSSASLNNAYDAKGAAISAVANTFNAYTILWNYENFTTANPGEAYICKIDRLTGTKSDADGTVMWNGATRTIAKQMINPNAVLPYNIPIYIVCRLSSSSATTGTNYLVWYSSGWKYASLPTPSAVGGTWTWADATDIILGTFVEPSSEAAFTDCMIFDPPWSSKQVSTDTVTASAAAPKTQAVKRTQRIYYRKDTSGAPATPGTATANWVTANGDVFGQWTTKVPRLTANADGTGTVYSYLYTCEQYELASGTVGYTAVLLDDSTTIIDGGKIVTGTIDANRIISSVVNAINANVSDTINASKINASALTIGQSQVTNLSTDLAKAGKRTYVSIRATAISYTANTAMLEATLYIDGTATTSGVTYVWLKDGTAISGATSRTYNVPSTSGYGLDHAYSCKCTWT